MPYRDLFEIHKEPKKPQTNYERIKAMTIEEMATLLFALRDTKPEPWGREKMLKWLESEVQKE